MKRKMDHIGGHDPWEIEIAYWINHKGADPDLARTFVIIRWMWLGDFRPLAAAIANAPASADETAALDGAILGTLKKLIDGDRLTAKHSRHRPRRPDIFIRDTVAALLHEDRTTNSADALQEIASTLNMSDESIRRAVRRWHKAQNKSPTY
jgi:hypothetical protein